MCFCSAKGSTGAESEPFRFYLGGEEACVCVLIFSPPHGPFLLSACGSYGRTPLASAYLTGDVHAVKVLESHGAGAVSDSNLQRLLDFAAMHGHDDIIRWLVEVKGAKADFQDKLGRTPLYWSVQ